MLGLQHQPVHGDGDALRVAMAEAEYRGAVRIVVRHRAVERQAQHLAVEDLRILGAILAHRQVRVADGDPQVSGAELDGAALVAGTAGRLTDGHDLEWRKRAVRGERATS